MQRLAERLLDSVKLENCDGNILATFPAVHTRLGAEIGAEDVVPSDLQDETSRIKTYSHTIPVQSEEGSLLETVVGRIKTTIGTSIRSMCETSMLHITVDADGYSGLAVVHSRVPTLAVIDDESADEFTASIIRCLRIVRTYTPNDSCAGHPYSYSLCIE
jgi:hypothetical protein